MNKPVPPISSRQVASGHVSSRHVLSGRDVARSFIIQEEAESAKS